MFYAKVPTSQHMHEDNIQEQDSMEGSVFEQENE